MGKLYILSQKKLDQIVEQKIEEAFSQYDSDLERELLMKRSNLAALQEQINPHFLYNALECIRGQALAENAGKVADAARALSQYFRYCISNKSSLVTLRDEINYVKDYVTIQQFRFQDRFVLEISVSENEVLDAVVPKLMLQPLVENAIIHGLADKIKDGLIRICVTGMDRHIEITVTDNGKGMTAAKLHEVCEKLMKPLPRGEAQIDHGKETGVALNNVNNRIKMLFGEEYGLSVFSGGPDSGTTAEIFLPFSYSVKQI